MKLSTFLSLNVYNNGINGDLILELPDGYNQEEYVRILSYPGNLNYTLTIRPQAGATSCTIMDNGSNDHTLVFEDARNVIIDGRAGGVGTTKVLNIIQRQKGNDSAIQFTSTLLPSANVTIRNCNIRSDGIWGVYFSNALNTVLEHCNVSTYTFCNPGTTHRAVDLGSSSHSIVRSNYIHNINAEGGSGIIGIEAYGPDQVSQSTEIYNNFISLGYADMDSLSRIWGIRARWSSAETCKIMHNSIHIGGYQAAYSSTRESHAIWQDRGGNLEIKNNIVVNERYGSYNHYAIYIDDITGYNDYDNNNYYVNSDENGVMGYWNGSYAMTLQNWRGFSGQDANSTDKRVWFVNPANKNLHLSGSSFVDEDLKVAPITGISYDIDGELRKTPLTFKGADEPSADVMVIYPNGGEVFSPGQTVTITWYDEISENVKIELYRSGLLALSITNSTASDGAYDWTIPGDLPLDNTYNIKITSINSVYIFDRSDLNFSVSDLLAPAAPSDLTAGGSSPSPWQKSGYFLLDWTNPADASGISQAKYRIGSAPTGNLDFDGTVPGTPPQSFYIGGDYTPGEYTLYMWLVDGIGNEDFNNYATVVLRLDYAIANPTNFQESHGVQNDVWTRTTSQPNFTWTAPYDHSGIAQYNIYFGPDQNSETATTSVTGTSYSTAAAEGTSYLRVQPVDNAGNIGSWVTGFTFKLDQTPPKNPTEVTESRGSVNNVWQNTITNPIFSWDGASDTYSGVNSYYIYWGPDPDGATSHISSSPGYGPPVSANNTYYLRISTTDDVGNRSADTTLYTFRHDGTPPVNPTTFTDATGNSQNNVWNMTGNIPQIGWDAASDPLSGVQNYNVYWGPDSLGINTSSPQTGRNYTPASVDTGRSYLRVSSVDNLYNEAPWITGYTYKFDNIAPQTVAGSPDTSNQLHFTVRWDDATDKGGSGISGIFDVRYKDGQSGTWTDFKTGIGATSAVFPATGEAVHGHTYYFEARAGDRAGNLEEFTEIAECSTIVDTSVADVLAPEPPIDLAAGGGAPDSPWQNDKTFTLSWTNPDDRSGITHVYYKLETAPAGSDDTTGSAVTSEPTIQVTATKQYGQLVYVWLGDGSGNSDYTKHSSVNLRLDQTPPTGTKAGAPLISSKTDFTVQWSGGTDGSGSGLSNRYDIQYRTDAADWTDWLTDYNGSSAMFNGEHGKVYYFEAAARDLAGNIEAFTGTAECSTQVDTLNIDTQAPGAPLSLTAGGNAPESPWQQSPVFKIDWTNPEDPSGIGRAFYKLNNNPVSNYDTTGSIGSGPPGYVEADSENGQDVFIWLEDGTGNADFNNHSAVTLRWDKTPPTGTIPTSPPASASDEFQLSWSGSTDGQGSGLTGGYDIMVKIDAGSWNIWQDDYKGNSISYTGDGGKTYWFKTLAYDSAGNIEQFESAAECSTLVQTPDTDAPLAPAAMAVSPAGWTNQNNFTVSWTNPENDANIAGAFYKTGSAPLNDDDGTYSDGSKTSISGITLESSGRQDIYIWLKDIAGNYNHNNRERATLLYDNVLPEFSHTPVPSAAVDDDIPISAERVNHDGFSDIKAFVLYYRKTGDVSVPNSLDLSPGQVVIPGSANTQRGVEYRIILEDDAGNIKRFPTSGYYSIQVLLTDQTGYPRTADGKDGVAHHHGSKPTDYRIFSVPFELNDKRPINVFEDDLDPFDESVWKLFDIADENLIDYNTIKNQNIVRPGKAFLLIVNKPGVVIDVGIGKSPKPADYVNLPLTGGWNLIGNPFDFDIPLDSLTINGVRPKVWYTGASGWTNNISHLRKWEGLAINNEGNAAQLRIGVGGGTATPLVSPGVAGPGEYRIRICAEGEASFDLDNYIGTYTEDNIPVHTVWHEPPRMPEAVGIRIKADAQDVLRKSSAGTASLSTWLQLPGEEGNAWDLSLQGDKAGESVRLDFQLNGEIPPDYATKLIDLDLKLVYDLEKLEWHFDTKMSSKGSRNFRLLIGSAVYVRDILTGLDMIPEGYELKQNFPNPFNLSTSLIFGLPATAKVHLDVYTILGEKVRTLIGGENFDSGYHMVVWDGRNDGRATVASGVYVFQWSAGKEVRIRKGILVK